MGWGKREAVNTDLVILGDSEGNAKTAAGLFVGIKHDKGYDKDNYLLELRNGDVIEVSGSASIARQLGPEDIGKFVKMEFEGWGRSPNGKFKAISVYVWEGETTEAMKAWPSFGKVAPPKKESQKQSKSQPEKPAAAQPSQQREFEDFPSALEETDDDLPF